MCLVIRPSPYLSGRGSAHFHGAQQLGVEALRLDGVGLGVAALPRMLAGTESAPVVLVGLPALSEVSVLLPHRRHGPAGVAHGDVLDRVGRGPQPPGRGVDDSHLEFLPVGSLTGAVQPRHGLVVAPPGGVNPEIQPLLLLPGGEEPYLSRFPSGTAAVRRVGRRRYAGWREYPR